MFDIYVSNADWPNATPVVLVRDADEYEIDTYTGNVTWRKKNSLFVFRAAFGQVVEIRNASN